VVRNNNHAVVAAAGAEHIAHRRLHAQQIEVILGDSGGGRKIVALRQPDLKAHPEFSYTAARIGCGQ
jgi:hypothetical protein